MKIKIIIILSLAIIISLLLILPLPDRIDKITRITKTVEKVYYNYLPFDYSDNYLDNFNLQMIREQGDIFEENKYYSVLINGYGKCELTKFSRDESVEEVISYSIPIESVKEIIDKSYQINFFNIDYDFIPPTCTPIMNIEIHSQTGQKYIAYFPLDNNEYYKLSEFANLISNKLKVDQFY